MIHVYSIHLKYVYTNVCFINHRFKGPRELYNSDKILMTVEGELATLTISDLFGEDQDEYSCELENPGGKKISRASLTIKCKSH